MVIEIIPKPAAKIFPWLNILFYFSLLLVIAAISSYFIFNNFQKKAEENLKNLEIELTRGKTPEEIALEEEVFGYQKKIGDFPFLINNHRLNSNSFKFLENISHPKVWFSDFDLKSNERKVQLSGITDSFQILGQQLLIFKNEKLIKEVNLSKISLDKEGKIEFTFNFLLDPEIFLK